MNNYHHDKNHSLQEVEGGDNFVNDFVKIKILILVQTFLLFL